MRKIRTRFNQVNLSEAAKYIFYFMLLAAASSAQTLNGLKPFGLGIFAALVFARRNILVIAPMYIISCLISDFSWQSLVIGAAPAIVFIIAYFAHHKLNKRMNVTFANLYVLISQIPYVVFAAAGQAIYNILLTVVLTQIFAYIAILAFYAVIIRGLKYKLTVDEFISVLVVIGVIALSLYNISYNGFNLFYLFYGFALLASAYAFLATAPLILGVVAGLGCAFAGGGISSLSICVCLAAAVAAFRNTNAFICAAAMLAADAVLGYYFGAYSGYGWINIAVPAAGALMYLIIPKRFKNRFMNTLSAVSTARAGKTVVNKNRQELSVRLYSLANIFEDMQVLLQGEAGVLPDVLLSRERLAKDIAASCCGKCDGCDACFSSLGSDTSGIIEDILETAERKGKASIIDMPPFITSRCRRINGLIQNINDKIDGAKECASEIVELDRGKQMLATQMSGVAYILDNLADEFKQNVSFDAAREKLIIDELTYHNILCREVMVYGEGGDINVSVLVRESDADKSALIKAVSKIMKVRLVRTGAFDSEGGFVSVHLAPAPRFDFVYGEAARRREGESKSGDTRCVRRISASKVIFAVSDGMGSGDAAESNSSRAIQMVENFYEAGFNNEVVLSLVNRLLSLRGDDSFSAIDLMVLDLNTGACDFIKLGATFTLIKRREGAEAIEGHSLPVGILDTAKPDVIRRILINNDLVLLLSDGVTDVLSEGVLKEFLQEYKGLNPQTLSEEILKMAADAGATDDVTAMAIRVFARL